MRKRVKAQRASRGNAGLFIPRRLLF